MDGIYKLTLCCVIAAILIVTLRSRSRELGLMASLAACALTLLAGIPILRDDLDFIRKLGNEAGLLSPVLSVLSNVCLISLLAQVCGTFCEDAGESALAKIVGLCGKAAALCAALPLMETLLDLLRELTGNL